MNETATWKSPYQLAIVRAEKAEAANAALLSALEAAVWTGCRRPFVNEDQAFWDAWLPRAKAAIASAKGGAS